MQQTRQNPAETYESFLVPNLFAPWSKVLIERARPRTGERVLDLACGTGIIARQIAPIVGSAGRVVGIDISPDMLAVARSLPAPSGAEVEWVQGNASELDFPPESFDLVVCQQGLQFFPDRAAAAKRVHRVLNDGGRAVIAVWQELGRHEVLEALFTAESRHLQLPLEQVATPFSLAGDAELRALLESAGFRDISVEPVSMDVRFPSAERWLELTVRAGAAVIPELAQDETSMSALLQTVQHDVGDAVNRYRDGEALSFPMFANVAVAYR
jgi:ubiquinone/menaquinone biosynthesis C-methylase UbiE